VQFFSTESRIAEDDGLFWLGLINVFEQRLQPVPTVNLQEMVLKVLRRGLVLAQVDSERILQVLLRQFRNLFRHGRGKQKGLVLVYEAADYEFDVRDKSHIEHFISFIEDESPDVRQAKLCIAEQVDEPSRGGNENLDPVIQLRHLDLDGKAAIDGRGCNVGSPGNVGDFSDVLQCQLAGRNEDQGLDGFNRRIDHLDERNGTGGGFSRPGFSSGDDIPIGQDVGEGFFLDGR